MRGERSAALGPCAFTFTDVRVEDLQYHAVWELAFAVSRVDLGQSLNLNEGNSITLSSTLPGATSVKVSLLFTETQSGV